MRRSILSLAPLCMLLLLGCAERRQVQTYLTSVSTEIPNLQKIGRQTEKAFDELRFGKRPKDLNQVADRLERAAADLEQQMQELRDSRGRVAAIPAPQPAIEFETHLLASYEQWGEVGQSLADLCNQAAKSCREIESSPPKGKWKRFAAAAQELGDEARALKKAVRDAGHASEDLGQELERLQRKYKLARTK